MDFNLRLAAKESAKLVEYTDADWAKDSTDHGSTSRFLFMYGDGPISWSSHKQDDVALSFIESEFIATVEACKELLWQKKLLKELGINEEMAIQMMEDNKSCMKQSSYIVRR